MKTRFNTGDIVYIPAKITEALNKDNKIYYRIQESELVIDEDICRTENQTVMHPEAEDKIKKGNSMEAITQKIGSMIDELASRNLSISINF